MQREAKRIFVTGGSGFLGQHFLSDALNHGYQIFALTRDSQSLARFSGNSGVHILTGDLMDIGHFALQISSCSYFVHMAGEKSEEKLMQEVNVNVLDRILPLCSGNSGLNFMHLSSSGVYGIWDHKDDVLTEESLCYPDTLYEKSKFDSEKLLQEYGSQHPLNYVILRPSNIFGENDKSYKLLNLMKSILRGRFFFISPDANVNYVYVRYVTSAMLQIIDRNHFRNQVININTPVTLAWFIEKLKVELGIRKQFIHLPSSLMLPITTFFGLLPRRIQLIDKMRYKALTSRKIYSNDKLNSIVSIDDKESMSVGIKNLVNHYRSLNLL